MKPSLPTVVIVLQGLCAALVGAAIPMAAALAQWVSADAPPSKVAWMIIVLGGIAGGGSKLSSFLSTSFADYKGNPSPPPTPTLPPASGTYPAGQPPAPKVG